MSLKIKLKMLFKKKEKCLSEYVQISVRGLSKQGLTPSLPMRSGPSARGRSAGLVPQLPAEQLSTSPPGKTLRQRGPQDKPRRTHADPGLADMGGDTHSCWREAQAVPQGRCAAGPSAPAAGRRERTEISPGEALNRYRNLSPRWGLWHRNLESHSQQVHSYWEPLETAAHPMKVQSQQQTTFLRECLLQTASLQPPVRSNH